MAEQPQWLSLCWCMAMECLGLEDAPCPTSTSQPRCPPLSIPSCSPSSLALLSPSSRPAEPRKEPLVCCVSCSSSEFYSAPLTLADRPQGKGQKDNCLQQFCPQLVSPSACRAAQPARHCLTNNIKFNSRCCDKEGREGEAEKNPTFGGRFSFHAQNPKLRRGKVREPSSPARWDGSCGSGVACPRCHRCAQLCPPLPPGRALSLAGAACPHAGRAAGSRAVLAPAGAIPAPGQRAGSCSCLRSRRFCCCCAPAPHPHPAPGWRRCGQRECGEGFVRQRDTWQRPFPGSGESFLSLGSGEAAGVIQAAFLHAPGSPPAPRSLLRV